MTEVDYLQIRRKHHRRATDRVLIQLAPPHASAVWAADSSASDGCDSCFAAAWRTRSFTAVVEGDVGRPTLLGSIFLAAHDNASAPTCTGDSNSLDKERTCNDIFSCWTCNPRLQINLKGYFDTKTGTSSRITYFRSCSKSSELSYVVNRE